MKNRRISLKEAIQRVEDREKRRIQNDGTAEFNDELPADTRVVLDAAKRVAAEEGKFLYAFTLEDIQEMRDALFCNNSPQKSIQDKATKWHDHFCLPVLAKQDPHYIPTKDEQVRMWVDKNFRGLCSACPLRKACTARPDYSDTPCFDVRRYMAEWTAAWEDAVEKPCAKWGAGEKPIVHSWVKVVGPKPDTVYISPKAKEPELVMPDGKRYRLMEIKQPVAHEEFNCKCGSTDWLCPTSPTGHCEYFGLHEAAREGPGVEYNDDDDCVYCHEPEERK